MAKNSPIKTFVFQFAKAVVAAVTVVLCSRFMGAAGRGELSLVLFYVNIIMIANEFVGGSSLANILLLEPGKRNLFASSIWAIFILIISAIVAWFVPFTHAYFVPILGIAFPLAFITILYSVFQAFGKVYQRNYIQLSLESLKLLLVVFGFYFFAGPLTIFQVSSAFALASVVVLLVSIYLLKSYIGNDFKAKERASSQLYKSGFLSQSGQLIQFFNYRLSLIFITQLIGLKETGIYANTLLIADVIWIFGNSFGTIAHMRILKSENPKFRADITLRYAAIAFAGSFIACLLFILVPNALFVTIFGTDFMVLKSTAIAFIPAILALGLSTVFSHYLHAINKFGMLLFANISGLALQAILAFILIPKFGLLGACYAADAGFILILIIILSQFRKDNPDVKLHGVFRFGPLKKVVLNMFR